MSVSGESQPSAVLNPRSSIFRVTGEGWCWLVLAAALLGIGIYKGINLLVLLACLLLMLWCVNALRAGKRLPQLRGRRWIDGPVFARTPLTVDVEVSNTGRGGAPALRLEDGGPGHCLSWFVPWLPGKETRLFRHTVLLPQRGRYRWGSLRAVSGYPLGLVRRQRILAAEETVLVLPRLGRLQRAALRRFLPPAGLVHEWARQALRRHPAAQSEFHGLRAFRSGDSPRWIHWRTTARCGELMVREFEDVPSEDLIVVLDLTPEVAGRGSGFVVPPSGGRGRRPPGPVPGARTTNEDLEEAISLTATVCWEWCRQKGNHLLLAVAAGGHPEGGAILEGPTGREHGLHLLECLAEQQVGPAPDRSLLIERLTSRPLPRAPVLLIGLGAADWAGQLEQSLQRPVAPVDLRALDALDFYERPTDHAP
jgi:uncharacterized protein (DUF58 family)